MFHTWFHCLRFLHSNYFLGIWNFAKLHYQSTHESPETVNWKIRKLYIGNNFYFTIWTLLNERTKDAGSIALFKYLLSQKQANLERTVTPQMASRSRQKSYEVFLLYQFCPAYIFVLLIFKSGLCFIIFLLNCF